LRDPQGRGFLRFRASPFRLGEGVLAPITASTTITASTMNTASTVITKYPFDFVNSFKEASANSNIQFAEIFMSKALKSETVAASMSMLRVLSI
jgi:hypothetical protein